MTFVKCNCKKRIWIVSLLTVIMLATIGGVMLFGKQDGYRTIKVFEVSGRVGVVHDGVEYEAYPGMILTEGYSIVTSSDSYVRLVLDGDKYIKLEEGSKAVFEQLGMFGSGKTTITLERGVILSEIVHSLKADENYIINTPNAVLAVRGTLFRVEVSVNKSGDKNTDVFTYGGAVSSQRIEPNGNLIEEEVIIDSGYKTTVKMDDIETIYVVETVETEKENTVPIRITDISDEDIVDMYHASKNGHEMFITTDDIKEEIEIREIDIEEHSSVYIKAESIEKSNSVTSVKDGDYIVKVENDVNNGQKPEDNSNQTQKPEDNSDQTQKPSQGMVSDGGHRHTRDEEVVEATCLDEGFITVKCSDCGELIAERILEPLGHKEAEPVVITPATCTKEGLQEINCDRCEIKLAEEKIPVVDHYEMAGGTKDSHGQCRDCGTIISTAHTYVDKVTKEPTCTATGELTHACGCGYSYVETVAKTTHKEKTTTIAATCTTEGKVITSCEHCGKVFSETKKAATGHSYTALVTKQATCNSDGTKKYTCACGHSYTEAITGGTHVKVNANASQSTCSSCGTKVIDFNSTNFPDSTFLVLLKADGIDKNNDGMLDSNELNAVTRISYHYKGITDATGLEHFTELTYLELIGNPASRIPIENLTKLELVNLGDTNITSVDVTKLTNLTNLQLYGTNITSIDLSKNTELAQLSLSNCTGLTSLSLDNNKKLQHIQLQASGIQDFQISGFIQLQEVWLTDCMMERVRVIDCPSLTTLVTPSGLTTFDISGCSSLLSVDLTGLKNSLVSVTLDGSGLRGVMDLSNCRSLQGLSANNCTSITGININNCSTLSSLSVTGSSAIFINASSCTALNSATVHSNVYLVESQYQTVDYTAVEGFDASKVTIVSGGTISNGIFYFDSGSAEIVYRYLLDDSVYGEYIIRKN